MAYALCIERYTNTSGNIESYINIYSVYGYPNKNQYTPTITTNFDIITDDPAYIIPYLIHNLTEHKINIQSFRRLLTATFRQKNP